MQHSGTRRSMPSVPLRRVRAGELRWEKFLYELKAGQRPADHMDAIIGP